MTDWSQLVRQHGRIVWKTVCRLLNNEADAADCFQETFLSALKLSRKQEVENWPGLLKQIATARALERLRKRYRELKFVTNPSDDTLIDPTAFEPSQATETAELNQSLRNALAELETRQAEVFCLTCLEGLTYQQVADRVGVTVNHVGVLLNRAKSNLQKRLREFRPASGPVSKGRSHHESS